MRFYMITISIALFMPFLIDLAMPLGLFSTLVNENGTSLHKEFFDSMTLIFALIGSLTAGISLLQVDHQTRGY